MAYTRTTWVNGETALNAAHMNNIEEGIAEAKSAIAAIGEVVYPVGSIYMSVNNVNPGTIFGGTWEKIEGRFLLGASSSYDLGAVGGSANAIVPYHKHEVTATIIPASGSHTHSMQIRTIEDKVASGTSLSRIASSGSNWEDDVVRLSGGASSGVHNHTVPAHSTQYAGTSGNATGANMPPYLVVNIWERTA